MPKRVRNIRADFEGPRYVWKIPKDLPLLSRKDNYKIPTSRPVPFSWYIEWGTFYYYDKDGQKQTLEETYVREPDLKYAYGISDKKEYDDFPDDDDDDDKKEDDDDDDKKEDDDDEDDDDDDDDDDDEDNDNDDDESVISGIYISGSTNSGIYSYGK